MTETDAHSTRPKSIRQKQILTIAEENPTATLTEIAADISGVSAAHVDRVLTQYGDPGTRPASTATSGSPAAADSTPASRTSSDTESPQDTTASSPADHPDDGATEAATEDASPSTAMPATDAPPSATSSAESTPNSESTSSVESTSNAASTSSSTTTPTADGTPSTQSSPAAQSTASSVPVSSTDGGRSTHPEYPDPGSLTQKEHETLRAIAHDTDATQQDVADMLGVSRATVSNRVNAVEGFDWADRDSFVSAVIDDRETPVPEGEPSDDASTSSSESTDRSVTSTGSEAADASVETDRAVASPPAANGQMSANACQQPTANDNVDETHVAAPNRSREDLQEIATTLEELTTLLETVTHDIAETADATSTQPLADSELLHKIVTVCMESDRIDEDEEIAILEAFVS